MFSFSISKSSCKIKLILMLLCLVCGKKLVSFYVKKQNCRFSNSCFKNITFNQSLSCTLFTTLLEKEVIIRVCIFLSCIFIILRLSCYLFAFSSLLCRFFYLYALLSLLFRLHFHNSSFNIEIFSISSCCKFAFSSLTF